MRTKKTSESDAPVAAKPARRTAKTAAPTEEIPDHIAETLELPPVTMRPRAKAPASSESRPAPKRERTPRPAAKAVVASTIEVTPELEEELATLREEIVPQFRARADKPAPVTREVPPAVEAIVGPDSTDADLLAAVANDFPGFSFRAREAAPATAPREGKLAPRRSRNRRDRSEPISAAEAVSPRRELPVREDDNDGADERPARRGRGKRAEPSVVASPPLLQAPPPPPPTRQIVPIPEDAPQVIHRDGHLVLVRNKRMLSPIFFTFGGEARNWSVISEQLRHVAASGIQVVGYNLQLTVSRDKIASAVSEAEEALHKILEIVPGAQVMFFVEFAAATGWEYEFTNGKYFCEDRKLALPSFSDDKFWGVAEDCLRGFCEALRQGNDADAVLGVHLDRDSWSYASNDTSLASLEKFREWLRMRYRNDLVAMRASWFDGSAEFDTVSIPVNGKASHQGEEFVRTDRRARRHVDYNLFLSDVVVERISKLAYLVKETTEGNFLVGVNYGFTFERSRPGNGHLALGKLLRTPEIDLLTGPPSYRSREAGGVAAFPGPLDSVALNGKLYVSLEDYRTPMAGGSDSDAENPVIRTPQDLESVHWRGLGAALAHQAAINWSDTLGQGWLNTATIWRRGALVREALVRATAAPVGPPDVAVFIDERSLAYLVDERAFELLVQNVREAVMRSGMSIGFYLLSDLAHRQEFPESRLYMFLNAWDIRPEVRSAIKTRLHKDGKVLFWLYAAGLFDGGREALERVREVTGIALRPQPFASKSGTQLIQRRHALAEALPESVLLSGGGLEPSYIAIPEDGMVIGEYSETGLPSFVLRHVDGDTPEQSWTSVFLGEPVVSSALVRALGSLAQAHVWNYGDDVVHVRAPFLSITCATSGIRTITLPDKWSAFNLQTGEWASVDSTHLRFTAIAGQTLSFLVGARLELEQILGRKLAQLETVDHIPPRAENTVRLDELNFDVQIVQLDEYMEESWGEDFADDFLLKPSALELDGPALDDDFGRTPERRNRRRGGRGSEPRTQQPEPSAGLNVVFRKRT
ncbi:MAG: hypothetical protein JNJ45_03345 [Chthonomonas sp.]|nr:hypothetical protein [Chthonomonas sp.]